MMEIRIRRVFKHYDVSVIVGMTTISLGFVSESERIALANVCIAAADELLKDVINKPGSEGM